MVINEIEAAYYYLTIMLMTVAMTKMIFGNNKRKLIWYFCRFFAILATFEHFLQLFGKRANDTAKDDIWTLAIINES